MPTPIHEQAAIRALLANLTVPNGTQGKSRMNEVRASGFKIESQHLPDDMPFERTYLDTLWAVDTAGDVPYEDTMLVLMKLKHPELDAAAWSKHVWEHATEDRSVRVFVANLAEKIASDELMADAQEFTSIVNSPSGTASERFNKAMAKLRKQRIGVVAQSPLSNVDRLDQFIERLIWRAERANRGLAVGVQMPFYDLRQAVPLLDKTEVALWTAPTKSGKTTFACEIAEVNAWEYGIPMLVMPRETNNDSMQARQIAKHLLIPTYAMKRIVKIEGGDQEETEYRLMVDPREDRWKKMLGGFRDQIIRFERQKAPVIFMPCAGWPNWMMENAIANFVDWCKAQGYESHGIIIDYLQKMNTNGGDERQSIVNNAEAVKVWADTYQTHITLFAQNDIAAKGAGKAMRENKVHGSQAPMHKAQVIVTINTKKPVGDFEVPVSSTDFDPATGELTIARNALGHERIWQKPGIGNDREVSLRVEMANDDQPTDCKVWVEWPLFRPEDVNAPTDADNER